MLHLFTALRKVAGRRAPGQSRCAGLFSWAMVVAAGVLVTRTLLLPPAYGPDVSFAGPARLVAWALTITMVALGGLFPLPLGHRMYLSLGSGAAFAALLVFPPVEALPLAFAGMLVTQLVRWASGERRPCAVTFNLAQYLVTWSLAAEVYHRTQAQHLYAHPVLSWVPVVAAGAVYLLVNTWTVSTMAALERHAWTWNVWARALREAAPGYLASLSLGAATAALAATRPVLVLMLVPSVAALRQVLARMSGVIVRQTGAAFEGLVKIVEQRSPYTAQHSERVAWWAQRVARHLELPEDEVEMIGMAARLHDLGKVIQRNNLEEKVGPLTPAERAVIRQHPEVGAAVIDELPGGEEVARYVRYHREWYDGSGYYRLSGDATPLGARIIGLADALDAMLSPRPYRAALTRDAALAQIEGGAGRQFDPRAVRALIQVAQTEMENAPVAGRGSGGILGWPTVTDN